MIRQILLAVAIGIILLNAVEELTARHFPQECITDSECEGVK